MVRGKLQGHLLLDDRRLVAQSPIHKVHNAKGRVLPRGIDQLPDVLQKVDCSKETVILLRGKLQAPEFEEGMEWLHFKGTLERQRSTWRNIILLRCRFLYFPLVGYRREHL